MTFLLRKIPTLTNPSLLHHRLLCTSNSGGSDNSLITFFRNYWGEQLPKKLKLITSIRNYRGEQLHEKLDQFDESWMNLKRSFLIDYKLFKNFDESRKASLDEIVKNVSKFRRLVACMDSRKFRHPKTRQFLENNVDHLLKSINRMGKITHESFRLAKFLKSRIDSYNEIRIVLENIETLSEIRNDWFFLKDLASLHEQLGKVVELNNEQESNEEDEELNEELWNELYEDLWDVDWDAFDKILMEIDWFEAGWFMKTDMQLDYLAVNYKQLYQIHKMFLSCN